MTDATATARASVLQQLALAHDHWSEEEQRATTPIEREGAHQYAVRCLRAYRAELDDQKPPKMPDAPTTQVNYWEWLRRGMGR